MTHDSENPSLRFPCATCMGFCIENTNCVRCSICINWFHQTCCKLSNRAFNELKSENPDVHFIENSDYICKFCTQLNSCDMCQLETPQTLDPRFIASHARYAYVTAVILHSQVTS